MLEPKVYKNKVTEELVTAVQYDRIHIHEIMSWIIANDGVASFDYHYPSGDPKSYFNMMIEESFVEVHDGNWVVFLGEDGFFVYDGPTFHSVYFEEVIIDENYMPTSWIELIAQTCHAANRAIQISIGDPEVSPVWEEAPNWQKQSAFDGVKKALGGATPEELHESWREFKRKDGWAYGEVKDAERKLHPCMVPYDQLSLNQSMKDEVFHAIVKTFKDMELG